ncbi:MAG TPA: peptidyl-prolyl cis-trans isomerase [Pyrinomonadaceae bacterium]|nr:peptidyl-prolyl cis-trans isomerase [Pyrinomonadaceae bacterium]
MTQILIVNLRNLDKNHRSLIVKFKYLAAFVALVIFMLGAGSAFAQEGEMQVVDEVIAQVNDDVITLSMLKRETKERIEALKQSGMTEQQATDEVNKRQAELIATLINEKLLLQKGKELDLANDIEAEVNRRMLQIAQEQGINSIEKLNQAMLQNGLKPEEVRSTMRTEMMKQAVLQQEVDRRVYLGFSTDEVKKYYDTHLDKFRKPESIKLSEIYLSSTGKDDASVKARAVELVNQIRAGADFGALAAANSEREKNNQRTAPQDKGYVGEFEVPSLREDLVASLKDVKTGGVTEPIKVSDGYQILRVDERTPAGTTPTFNDNRVREAMLMEQQPKERETYLQSLRNEAFIKVTDAYRAGVDPLLKIASPVAAKTEEKKDNKKPKKP